MRASKEWCHNSPLTTKTKKCCTQQLAWQIMLSLFWDEKGRILKTPFLDTMDKRAIVTNVMYGDLYKNQLCPATMSKWHGLLIWWRGEKQSARTATVTSFKKDFFSVGIHEFLKYWNICIAHHGDYIEKWGTYISSIFNKIPYKK